MLNFDYITRENIKEQNPNWPHVPAYPYRMLLIGGSGCGKAKALLYLISHQPDVDKIFSKIKDPYKAKYQLLIRKCKDIVLKQCNDSRAFIKYSNDMDENHEKLKKAIQITDAKHLLYLI